MSRRCACGPSAGEGYPGRVFGSESPGHSPLEVSRSVAHSQGGGLLQDFYLPCSRAPSGQIQALGLHLPAGFLQGSFLPDLDPAIPTVKAGRNSTSIVGPRALLSPRGRNPVCIPSREIFAHYNFNILFQERIPQIKEQLTLLALSNVKLTSVHYHMQGNGLIARFPGADIC